jgi:hypothetical protein
MAPRSLDHYEVTFTGTGTSASILANPGRVLSDRSARVMPPA